MWWIKDPEKRLLVKIDFFILSFCCVTYFFNYLDRSNLTNAYVSGMEEELAFKGNQLTVINTIFTVGYILGQVPSNLALTYLPPRIFFPSMVLLWGGLTMITAAVHNPQGIMAIRFFLGLAEASTFSGTHYILGSWYAERELGKRSGIFTASGLAGTMFGGFIQTGIHSSLDGAAGLSGWRWLFIVSTYSCYLTCFYYYEELLGSVTLLIDPDRRLDHPSDCNIWVVPVSGHADDHESPVSHSI